MREHLWSYRLSLRENGYRQSAGKSVKYVKIREMDKTQRDIVIGTLLGDGCLEFNGYRGTRLQIKQKDEHKQYVMWLYKNLSDLCKTPPQQRKDTKQWYFSTRAWEDLTDLHKIFYSNHRKKVPTEGVSLMTSPLSIAVWYMDDGTLDYRPRSHYNFRLSTDSFTTAENKLLVNMLNVNFGINASICNSLCRGKKYHRLYIGAKGRNSFLNLIRPYVVKPCFSRKIPLF